MWAAVPEWEKEEFRIKAREEERVLFQKHPTYKYRPRKSGVIKKRPGSKSKAAQEGKPVRARPATKNSPAKKSTAKIHTGNPPIANNFGVSRDSVGPDTGFNPYPTINNGEPSLANDYNLGQNAGFTHTVTGNVQEPGLNSDYNHIPTGPDFEFGNGRFVKNTTGSFAGDLLDGLDGMKFGMY